MCIELCKKIELTEIPIHLPGKKNAILRRNNAHCGIDRISSPSTALIKVTIGAKSMMMIIFFVKDTSIILSADIVIK